MGLTASPLPLEIRRARLAAGLSQRAAAELISYTKRGWANWEYGITRMRPQLFELFRWKVARGARLARKP